MALAPRLALLLPLAVVVELVAMLLVVMAVLAVAVPVDMLQRVARVFLGKEVLVAQA
jgi:hypothetical protein